ncbi:hypothetical protein BDB00DRAFT_846642, partial [Zychaea mexicana]|uniref:uncharacterized protein n=1 Tax=Zychaea mexicana TaxID=64656 RepID=UPI0022FE9135
MARFADCFWDENDKGVEVVTEKLKNSRQTCDEINSLYEIRAQIEEEYGEKLLKLSQMMVGQAEEGALSESVSHIPSAIETTARAHMDLAQQLRHNLQSALNGFLKDHNEKCKAQEQQIENSKQLRVMHHANVLKAKDQYFAEHTKLAGMEKYLKDQRTELDPDEVQQVAEDIEEQKKLLATADQQYKRAVDVLNDVTEKWIADWRGTCDIYQGLEESRINFIRSSLWGFANMMSSVYIVDDQCCERIRSSLESTDVQQDVQTFIGKYSTGTRVTDLMPYEDLSQPGAHPNRGSQAPPPTIALPPPPTALPDVPEETYNKPSPPSISSSRSRQSGQSGFDNTRNSAASTRDLSENIPATTTTTTTAAMRQSVPPIINPAPSKERAMYRDRQNHQGRDDHDTVSFAFEEVENMLSSVGTSLDVSNGGLRQSLVWATQQQQQQQPAGSMANNHHPAQTQRPISPPPPSTGSSQTPAVVTTPATDDPTSPQQPLSSITPSALANAVNAASSSAPIPVMHPSESSRSRLSAVGVSSPSHTAPPLSNNVPSSSSATPSDTSSPPIPRSISPGPSQQQQQQP